MRKTKVIIADNNEIICQMIKNELEHYYEFEILAVCNSEQEEQNLIKKLEPDILITDIFKSDIKSGLDVIKELKKYRKCMRILVISAADYTAQYTEFVDAFIKKPIKNLDEIYKKLKYIE